MTQLVSTGSKVMHAYLLARHFLTSLDIQDAYLNVPIFSPHQCYLYFAVGNLHYQFVALSFGLSTALKVLTKVLAPALFCV